MSELLEFYDIANYLVEVEEPIEIPELPVEFLLITTG